MGLYHGLFAKLDVAMFAARRCVVRMLDESMDDDITFGAGSLAGTQSQPGF
jgi:hypothetical protein